MSRIEKYLVDMNKTATKALAMIFLGGGSLLLGLVPMKLKKWFKRVNDTSKYENIFSSLLCFGGGLLLATSLLNILPEVTNLKPSERLKYTSIHLHLFT